MCLGIIIIISTVFQFYPITVTFLQIQNHFLTYTCYYSFKYLVCFFPNILCKIADQILNQIPKILWTIIAVCFFRKAFILTYSMKLKSWPAHFWELNRDWGWGGGSGNLFSQNLCDKQSRKCRRSEVVRSKALWPLCDSEPLLKNDTDIDTHTNTEYKTLLGEFPLLHHGKGLQVCLWSRK